MSLDFSPVATARQQPHPIPPGQTSDQLQASPSLSHQPPAPRVASKYAAVSGSSDKTILVWKLSIGPDEEEAEAMNVSRAASSETLGEGGEKVEAEERPGELGGGAYTSLGRGAEGESEQADGMQGEDGSVQRGCRVGQGRVVTMEREARLSGHKHAVSHVVYTSDGGLVVSASADGTLKVWSTKTCLAVRTLSGHTDAVLSVDVNRDATLVASASQDHTVRLWNLATGKQVKVLMGHRSPVRCCRFSADDAVILSGGFDRRAIAWVRSSADHHSWQRAGTVGEHVRGIMTCALSNDGMVAITGGWDKTLRMHPLEDIRLNAALALHEDVAPFAHVAPASELRALAEDATIKAAADGLASLPAAHEAGVHVDLALHAMLSQVLPGMESSRPGLTQVVSEIVKMVGVQRAKIWVLYMTNFLAVHAGAVGMRTRQVNAVLLGQQGTGKLHFAKLFARFLLASGMLASQGDGVGSGGAGAGKERMAAVDDGRSCVGGAVKDCEREKEKERDKDKDSGSTFAVPPPLFEASSGRDASGSGVGGEGGDKGGGEDTWPLVVLRVPKLAGRCGGRVADVMAPTGDVGEQGGQGGAGKRDSSPFRSPLQTASQQTAAAANLTKFLEKHKGQVILIKDVDAAPPELLKTVAHVIQKFLTEKPGSLAILISCRNRREVGMLLSHYQPATPETVRGHFPYIIDFDRYSAHDLMTIFRRQCESELVRLSTSATEMMLERAFALNFNFFDGTNGAGTRHLLKLARMEYSRRGGGGVAGGGGVVRGKKEMLVLESTDVQAAFQRLRQDWFAAHPDKTFTALMDMQAADKGFSEQRELRRRQVPSKSLDIARDGENDAKLVVEELDAAEVETQDAINLDRWTLEDFRVFHEAELKRQKEAHLASLNREREECRLVVEQTQHGHAAALQRLMEAVRKNIQRADRVPTVRQHWDLWLQANYSQRRRLHLKTSATALFSTRRTASCLQEWMLLQRRRRVCERAMGCIRARSTRLALAAVFGAWHALVSDRAQAVRDDFLKYHRFVTGKCLRDEVAGHQAIDSWVVSMSEEQAQREMLYEHAKLEQSRCDEIERLTKRHHSELSDWRREFETKLKDSKIKLKTANDTLRPLQIWRWYATWAAVLLVISFMIPTVPALLPGIYWLLRQLDFPHWLVGGLIWVFLGGAVIRLVKWLSKSVLPPGPIKACYVWIEEWGIDSILLGVIIAVLCWPYASAPPTQVHLALGGLRSNLLQLQVQLEHARAESKQLQLQQAASAVIKTADVQVLDDWQGPLPRGNRCPEVIKLEAAATQQKSAGDGGRGGEDGGHGKAEWDRDVTGELDALLVLLLLCGPQVKYVCQIVIVVASTVTLQEIKVLVAQTREQGLFTVIKTSAAKMMPSWIYSLHNHTIKELLEVVEDTSVPVGKRVKALKRLHAHAAVSCEQSDHICHWGGMTIMIDMLILGGPPSQHQELFEESAKLVATLCRSQSGAELIIRDRIKSEAAERKAGSAAGGGGGGGGGEGKGSPSLGMLDAKATVQGGGRGGSQVSVGLRAVIGLLVENKCKHKVVMCGLQALSNIAATGPKHAEVRPRLRHAYTPAAAVCAPASHLHIRIPLLETREGLLYACSAHVSARGHDAHVSVSRFALAVGMQSRGTCAIASVAKQRHTARHHPPRHVLARACVRPCVRACIRACADAEGEVVGCTRVCVCMHGRGRRSHACVCVCRLL
jgi:hypothetical protein